MGSREMAMPLLPFLSRYALTSRDRQRRPVADWQRPLPLQPDRLF